MDKHIPTQLGDVLILRTDHSFTLHAVGQVTQEGQQDFHTHVDVKYARASAGALTDARALAVPGRKIFLRNLDTGDWTEISTETLHIPPVT
jgi:hypothetical protein